MKGNNKPFVSAFEICSLLFPSLNAYFVPCHSQQQQQYVNLGSHPHSRGTTPSSQTHTLLHTPSRVSQQLDNDYETEEEEEEEEEDNLYVNQSQMDAFQQQQQRQQQQRHRYEDIEAGNLSPPRGATAVMDGGGGARRALFSSQHSITGKTILDL